VNRRVVFFCALLLTYLAATTLNALASPMLERVGPAQVMLVLSPDPPVTGVVHGVIHVSGVSANALARTSVRFQTNMTSMGMHGPAGAAARDGNTRGDYVFDVTLGMAAPWSIDVQFSGALRGSATFQFTVIDKPGSTGGTSGMSGMQSSSGNPDAWRNALFAIIVLALVGAFVLRRDRTPRTMGLFMAAGLLVLILAILQYRYTTPATDMTSMSNMQGTGATPVSLAVVRSGQEQTTVFAPGTVQPYLTQDIVTRAPGILQNFNFYAGDHVGAGQVLATLDAPELGSQAQAAYANA